MKKTPTAEPQSSDPKDSSSRFVGTNSLVKIYKAMTPGEKIEEQRKARVRKPQDYHTPVQRIQLTKPYRKFEAGRVFSVLGNTPTHIIVRDGKSRRDVPKEITEPVYETIIPFSAFLAETPFEIDSSNADKEWEQGNVERLRHNHPTKDVEFKDAPWKKHPPLKGHSVMSRTIDGHYHEWRAVHPKSGKVMVQLHTDNHEKGGQVVTHVAASRNSPVKAHEFYHHILTNNPDLVLHSDTTQTKGGQHVWKNLSGMPGVEMKHIHNKNGEEMPLERSRWEDNYGEDSHFTAKVKKK